MSSELAIDKLRRMQRKLPPDKTGPELADMLAVLEGVQQAEAELRAAAESQPPRRSHWWDMDGADRNPELFKGLLHLTCAVLLGLSMPLTVEISQPFKQLLLTHSLAPISQPADSEHVSLHPPSSGPGGPPISSLTFLQMLVTGMLMSAFTHGSVPNKPTVESAVGLVSHALEAAWPSAADAGRQAIERHLAARSWVPYLNQEARPAWRNGMLSTTAAALQHDLQRHTPEVSLTELRCLVLLQRVSLIGMASEPAAPAERAQREMQRLLDCQQVLALCSGASTSSLLDRVRQQVAHSAVLAALDAMEPAVRGRGSALNDREDLAMAMAEEAVPSALAAKRWMAAHGLARSLASRYWSSAQTFPHRGTPRSDALAAGLLRRAEALMGSARGCLPHLRRWLPQLQMQAHEHYQRRFEEGLAEAHQGLPFRPENVLPLNEHAPCLEVYVAASRCAQCSECAPHLRKCACCKAVAYCSRECQVKHWKEGGHKAECGRLAAQQGG